MPPVPLLTEFDYVLEEDRERPREDQAVFRLKPLTYKQRTEADRVEIRRDPDGNPIVMNDRLAVARRVLNMGLMGWSGLKDAEGKEIPFSRGKKNEIQEELLDFISTWAVELANAIYNNSRTTQEQVKN